MPTELQFSQHTRDAWRNVKVIVENKTELVLLTGCKESFDNVTNISYSLTMK